LSGIERVLGEKYYVNNRFLALFRNGRIPCAYYTHYSIPEDRVDLKEVREDELRDRIKKRLYYYLGIDMSPFEITDYRSRHENGTPFQSAETSEKMRVKIKDLEFNLSPSEEDIWDKWIKSLQQ